MITETFMQEDLQTLVTDVEDLGEWKQTISELELSGQQKLATDEGSPIPFLFMNESMINMFKTLCPATDLVEDFSKGTIPLKALSAIALAKQEKYFSRIEIWYDDVDPDPIAVGFHGDRSYSADKYLIARWGAEAADFDKLRTQATMRWMDSKKTQLEETIADAKSNLDKIDVLAKKHMSGQYVGI